MKKEFKKGMLFELNGNIYRVTKELNQNNWIYYEYEDRRDPKRYETMCFMPHSNYWMNAIILNQQLTTDENIPTIRPPEGSEPESCN